MKLVREAWHVRKLRRAATLASAAKYSEDVRNASSVAESWAATAASILCSRGVRWPALVASTIVAQVLIRAIAAVMECFSAVQASGADDFSAEGHAYSRCMR
jgi:hypothetical protein